MLFICVPSFPRGRNDVSPDLYSSLHASEEGRDLILSREQPRYGPAPFRDHDLFPASLDFIQEVKTLRLKLTGGYTAFHAMVIISWSRAAKRSRMNESKRIRYDARIA